MDEGGRRTDAEAVLAEARKAFRVMVRILVVLWLIQVANALTGYGVSLALGTRAHDIGSLPTVFTSPLVHASWQHIEYNSGPLFIYGFLAAFRGVRKFLWVTLVIMAVGGVATWLVEPPGVIGVGASGVIFGWFGYVLVRGLFDRHGTDIVIGLVMVLCFAYTFQDLLPQSDPTIGWQAHLAGLITGVVCGWLFRERRPKKAGPAPAAGLTLPDTPTTSL